MFFISFFHVVSFCEEMTSNMASTMLISFFLLFNFINYYFNYNINNFFAQKLDYCEMEVFLIPSCTINIFMVWIRKKVWCFLVTQWKLHRVTKNILKFSISQYSKVFFDFHFKMLQVWFFQLHRDTFFCDFFSFSFFPCYFMIIFSSFYKTEK